MTILAQIKLIGDDEDFKEAALKELDDFFKELSDAKSIETRFFADRIATWSEKYRVLGTQTLACRESVYIAAERYLSLRELVRVASYLRGAKLLQEAVHDVRHYFALE